MPTTLLPVPHRKQKQEADCLAACVAMVLDFLQQPIAYHKILALLETSAYGAIASRVKNLSTWGLQVVYSDGELTTLQQFLDNGQPVITLVRTGELPHWSYDTMHAIVLIGYDEHQFYANDPSTAESAIPIPIGDFDLGWFEMGNRYVVIMND